MVSSPLWRFNCIAVEPVWQPLYFVQCSHEFGAYLPGFNSDAKPVGAAAVSQLSGQDEPGVANGFRLMAALVAVEQLGVEKVQQVVTHQGGRHENCLGGPEAVHVERAESQSFFEIFDHVFVFGARTVFSPYFDGGKFMVVGDENAVTVLPKLFILLEERHLLAMLPGSAGPGFHVLAHHNVAPGPRPFRVGVLEGKFAHFETFLNAFPLGNLRYPPLDGLRDRHGQNVGMPFAFKVFDKLDEIKSAVAQYAEHAKMAAQGQERLFEKTMCIPGPRRCRRSDSKSSRHSPR